MLTQDRDPIPREKAINFIPIEIIKKMGQEAAEQEFEEKKRKKAEMKRMAELYKQKQMIMEQTGDDNIFKESEEEQSSFWLNNINTGDVYRSFIKGTNPWAKSSGFTPKSVGILGIEGIETWTKGCCGEDFSNKSHPTYFVKSLT
jgi:hypothetical protein